jgi:diguanylate cyclase (GGDEF)-like protein
VWCGVLINELFTTDIEMRLRSTETVFLLRAFREARLSGQAASIAVLDSNIMRAYGAHLAVMEQVQGSEFAFLYSGAEIPTSQDYALGGKNTTQIDARSADFYRLGCLEALKADDAILINHRTHQKSRVHRWESLFLPMVDTQSNPILVVLTIPRDYKDDFQRLILDSAPDGMVAAYPVRGESGEIIDARIVAANRRAAEYFGVENADALQEVSILGVFSDTDSNGSWKRNIMALRANKAHVFEYQHRDSLTSRWFRVVSTPMREGVLINLSDITDMKRALLELEHQRKLLLDEVEQRRSLEQELWSLAHLDPLTGLANRRAFREQATLKLAESQSIHRPCAVVSLDLDHFKRINDAYGHGAGDAVLRRVSEIIKATLRPNTDIAARMGGEEFSVILPETDLEAAVAFAEKLRRRIEQTMVIVNAFEIVATISAGIATNRVTTNLDELLERADRALYAAKRAGRNKVVTELDLPEETAKASASAA